MIRQAKDYVQSPEGRAKLAQIKDQISQRKNAPRPTRAPDIPR